MEDETPDVRSNLREAFARARKEAEARGVVYPRMSRPPEAVEAAVAFRRWLENDYKHASSLDQPEPPPDTCR